MSCTATTTPSTGARTGAPNPTNVSGASTATHVLHVCGADSPRSSTATKSMACETPNASVPWLGTRRAGEFSARHSPVKG